MFELALIIGIALTIWSAYMCRKRNLEDLDRIINKKGKKK